MPLVVYSHMHIWRALPEGEHGPSTIVSAQEDVPAERALEVMDRNGVDRAVLIQPMFRGEDNHYLVEAMTDHPDRLATVCVVDPRIPGADERLEYWAAERGCKGLRLRPRVAEETAVFESPAILPLWGRARKLGVVISVLANPRDLARIGELAERFPEVAIVIDHLAHPRVEEGVNGDGFRAMLALARFPNVHVKMSGYFNFSIEPDPYLDCWPLFQNLLDHFGPTRLIWGSDFPHVEQITGYARALDLVRNDLRFLDDATRTLILGENANRLYWP